MNDIITIYVPNVGLVSLVISFVVLAIILRVKG